MRTAVAARMSETTLTPAKRPERPIIVKSTPGMCWTRANIFEIDVPSTADTTCAVVHTRTEVRELRGRIARACAANCAELRRIARACAIVYTISETHSPAALPSGSASDGRPGELLWRAIFFAVAASFAARFARRARTTMPTTQTRVASVSTEIHARATGCTMSARTSAPGWSIGPTSGSVKIAHAMQYVPTCWSLEKEVIRSTRPISTMLNSSFDTITTGTESETGPNHEPTMYATEATPISTRLSTIMMRSRHFEGCHAPIFVLNSGNASTIVEDTSRKPPNADSPMQSGVDGWKPEPPPVEFVPFVALNQSPEAKSDSVIWRETLRGGTVFVLFTHASYHDEAPLMSRLKLEA